MFKWIRDIKQLNNHNYSSVLKLCDKLEVGDVYQIGDSWFVYLGYVNLINDSAYTLLSNTFDLRCFDNSIFKQDGTKEYYSFIKLDISIVSNSYDLKSIGKLVASASYFNYIVMLPISFLDITARAIRSVYNFKRNDVAFSNDLEKFRAKSLVAGYKILYKKWVK